MEGSVFDSLTRAIAGAGTRRRVLALVSSLPVAGLLHLAIDDPDARAQGRRGRRHQAQHEHRHAKTARRKAQRDETHSEACIPTGQRCPSKKPRGKHSRKLSCKRCCQQTTATDATGKKVCACFPNGSACTTDAAFTCCTGICTDGACSGVAKCPVCTGTTPICEGTTCVACTSTTQCPANTICMPDGSCQPCDVCPSGCSFMGVQAAIDSDTPQLTTIRVCPGTYVGNIEIPRDLTLIGAGDGTGAGNTTLQGDVNNQPNSVVTIDPLGQTVTLRSLRITGGFDDLGGGICHQGASLTMIDCTVTGNTADMDGGGLCSDPGSVAFLTDCAISGNHATGGGGSAIGGGIFCADAMTLTDCLVEANTSESDGAGIYVSNAAPDVLTLIRTIVRTNEANGTGGGIFNSAGSNVDLQSGTSVSGNSATAEPNCGGPGTYTDPNGACAP